MRGVRQAAWTSAAVVSGPKARRCSSTHRRAMSKRLCGSTSGRKKKRGNGWKREWNTDAYAATRPCRTAPLARTAAATPLDDCDYVRAVCSLDAPLTRVPSPISAYCYCEPLRRRTPLPTTATPRRVAVTNKRNVGPSALTSSDLSVSEVSGQRESDACPDETTHPQKTWPHNARL